jgi:hypothetical protein
MVLPVGQSDAVQTLLRVTRRGEKAWDYEELRAVRFVPLVGGPRHRVGAKGGSPGDTGQGRRDGEGGWFRDSAARGLPRWGF